MPGAKKRLSDLCNLKAINMREENQQYGSLGQQLTQMNKA
jgi:hypothetical protein|tara:strand:+ start:6875 stop:6994 length:120 start_codon:yes stop_codon:yes gene_type:complete